MVFSFHNEQAWRWAAPAHETMERPPAAIRRAYRVIVRRLSDASISISMCCYRYYQYAWYRHSAQAEKVNKKCIFGAACAAAVR
jgi:hypothetical protein